MAKQVRPMHDGSSTGPSCNRARSSVTVLQHVQAVILVQWTIVLITFERIHALGGFDVPRVMCVGLIAAAAAIIVIANHSRQTIRILVWGYLGAVMGLTVISGVRGPAFSDGAVGAGVGIALFYCPALVRVFLISNSIGLLLTGWLFGIESHYQQIPTLQPLWIEGLGVVSWVFIGYFWYRLFDCGYACKSVSGEAKE
jgi:hypothetical protein